jgi:hypothetical protein
LIFHDDLDKLQAINTAMIASFPTLRRRKETMLTLDLGSSAKTCDGVSRRHFMKIGALGVGGLTLADLLRLEADAGAASPHKAIINIHMNGGPSHQDIFDLKPSAPVEYRGEFNPIETNVAGMEICEHLPKLATMADKFAVVRSLVGSSAGHSDLQTHTGYGRNSLEVVGGRPSIGAIASRLIGAGPEGAPAWVSYNKGPTGFFGPRYGPFEGGKSLKLNTSLTPDRLDDRTELLGSLDRLRREMDTSGQMDALDSYTQTAVGIVTSGTMADALDIKLEDPNVVARYGKVNSNLLLARRLVQAGVRVITLRCAWGNFDTHSDNFTRLKKTNLPNMDQGLSALLWDLDRLGMLNDTMVVSWGEFGRTPRIANKGGRNHWPKVSMAFMAGGGLKTGQMVGSTDRHAGEAQDRPLHFQEVHATMHHSLGIDSRSVTVLDPAGRPQYLLEPEYREPIRELV